MSRLFYIKTFGCQMNEHDSAKMALLLGAQGYEPSDDPFVSDIVLFNTCTIREKAHHKAISEMGRAAEIKRKNPGTIVGVCGCVAQEEGGRILERFPKIDFVLGPDQLWRLPEMIERAGAGETATALDLIDDLSEYHFLGLTPPAAGRRSSATAFVTVMKGCNCACSYCIVPSVRGREISRPVGEIVEEVRRLVEAGAKEVTMLGQNVCAYGKGSGSNLAALIRRVADETGIMRIRFTSPHPRDVTDELVREYRDNPKLAPHIHLPAQAGSDSVLRRMHRGYTRERYMKIAQDLRQARPGISITTDLIVGFCGETDADFEETLGLMQSVEFDSAFAFKYSPRPGTEAAERMQDDVPQAVKESRLKQLLDLQRAASRRRNESLVGSTGEVLAAGLDRMGNGLVTGRLADNRIVHFAGQEGQIGSIVRVRITAANDNSLAGEATG